MPSPGNLPLYIAVPIGPAHAVRIAVVTKPAWANP
jgi:hypothetical protein